MCHLSSEGGFTFLVKEQAADLDQKFIYNCYYRGIVITTQVLKKNLLSIIKLDQDGPNKVILEHGFISSFAYYLIHVCYLILSLAVGDPSSRAGFSLHP